MAKIILNENGVFHISKPIPRSFELPNFIDCHYIFYCLFSKPLYFLCSLLYHCV